MGQDMYVSRSIPCSSVFKMFLRGHRAAGVVAQDILKWAF
jgi:hypothetical protein